MSDELEIICNEVVVVCYESLSKNFPEGTDFKPRTALRISGAGQQYSIPDPSEYEAVIGQATLISSSGVKV